MGTQRRNIVESLSTAQRAFLTLPERIEMHEMQDSADGGNPQPATMPRIAPTSLPRRTRNRDQAIATRFNRPEPLRSVTMRLRASTAETLRRVSMQRSLEYVEPFTQQAIVEVALTAWLRSNSFDSDAM